MLLERGDSLARRRDDKLAVEGRVVDREEPVDRELLRLHAHDVDGMDLGVALVLRDLAGELVGHRERALLVVYLGHDRDLGDGEAGTDVQRRFRR